MEGGRWRGIDGGGRGRKGGREGGEGGGGAYLH